MPRPKQSHSKTNHCMLYMCVLRKQYIYIIYSDLMTDFEARSKSYLFCDDDFWSVLKEPLAMARVLQRFKAMPRVPPHLLW